MLTGQLITKGDEFAELCRAMAEEPRVAFDMEFVPEDTYNPELCLLQIATDNHLVAVDLLATGKPLCFWELVLGDGREVVVHAGKEELAACYLHTGQMPSSVFDVQIAAGFSGMGYPISHTRLVRKVLGLAVGSEETRTDWRRRPLAPEQIEYALDDVRHLLALRDRLAQQIAQRGRTQWVQAEIVRLVHEAVKQENGERFRRVAGSGGLSSKELAVLREVYEWREERARQLDKPVRRVMRDDLLTECAKRQPKTAEQLGRIRGMEGVSKSGASKGVLDAIRHGLAVPKEECPVPLRDRPLPDEQMILKLLSALLNHAAQAQGIAVELLGTNDDLRHVMDWCIAGKPEDNRPKLVRDWRVEVCGNQLVSCLDGNVSVSIATRDGALELVFDDQGAPAG